VDARPRPWAPVVRDRDRRPKIIRGTQHATEVGHCATKSLEEYTVLKLWLGPVGIYIDTSRSSRLRGAAHGVGVGVHVLLSSRVALHRELDLKRSVYGDEAAIQANGPRAILFPYNTHTMDQLGAQGLHLTLLLAVQAELFALPPSALASRTVRVVSALDLRMTPTTLLLDIITFPAAFLLNCT